MGCKHYVKGTAYYQAIKEKFYGVPMNQPTFSDKDKWSCSEYRIVVSVQDEEREERCKSYIEFSHTPLRQVSHGHADGLGKVLYDNAVASNILKNDCHPGLNDGSMAIAGIRRSQDLLDLLVFTKNGIS